MKRTLFSLVVLAIIAFSFGSCDNVATPEAVPVTGPDTIQVSVDSAACANTTVAPTETVNCK